MPYPCLLHEKAHQEYIEAYEWYEVKQKGLGDRFMKSVEGKHNQISEHPEYYGKRQHNYKEAKVDNFPFAIVYEFFKNKELIHISAIFHTKRNPKRKYRKI